MKRKELKLKFFRVFACLGLQWGSALNVGVKHSRIVASRSIHSTTSSSLFCAVSLEFQSQTLSSLEDPFLTSLRDLGVRSHHKDEILRQLATSGLIEEDSFETTTLRVISQDFLDRPELISSILIQDFGLSPLAAHQTRAAAVKAWGKVKVAVNGVPIDNDHQNAVLNGAFTNGEQPKKVTHGATAATEQRKEALNGKLDRHPTNYAFESSSNENSGNHHSRSAESEVVQINSEITEKRPTFKAVHVAPKAQARKTRKADVPDEYGMPQEYASTYSTLAQEIDEFYHFMTKPSTKSQEDPIRAATAVVYKRHALLFLGWYVKVHLKKPLKPEQQSILSINEVIPSKDKDSAQTILDYVLWLRSERQISVSYEANILRGLTKLLKYRFRNESQTDTSYGVKAFDDIPVVRELRKLHRDANKRQSAAPKSSDEERKWISWPEYLQVVENAKTALERLREDFRQCHDGSLDMADSFAKVTPTQRKIAVLFQKYLILAFFANIPDRQRTVRELELGRSFIKDKKTGVWSVRHTPEDYKTGNAYGERPLLALPACLSPAIDEFIEIWRGCLHPQTEKVFCQVRTGKALTQDSVYQIVARSCYEYTGKRTNPHLLRDMIVTHVRESSEASEKQLEALALFMGHSINIQRSSYDRRTLSTKVAPAVQLIQTVNSNI